MIDRCEMLLLLPSGAKFKTQFTYITDGIGERTSGTGRSEVLATLRHEENAQENQERPAQEESQGRKKEKE